MPKPLTVLIGSRQDCELIFTCGKRVLSVTPGDYIGASENGEHVLCGLHCELDDIRTQFDWLLEVSYEDRQPFVITSERRERIIELWKAHFNVGQVQMRMKPSRDERHVTAMQVRDILDAANVQFKSLYSKSNKVPTNGKKRGPKPLAVAERGVA